MIRLIIYCKNFLKWRKIIKVLGRYYRVKSSFNVSPLLFLTGTSTTSKAPLLLVQSSSSWNVWWRMLYSSISQKLFWWWWEWWRRSTVGWHLRKTGANDKWFCVWLACVCVLCVAALDICGQKKVRKWQVIYSPLKCVDFAFYLSDCTAKHKFWRH